MKETAGWIAALGNALSSAAMPLIAANMLLPGLARGLVFLGGSGTAAGIYATAGAIGVLKAALVGLTTIAGLGAVAAAVGYLASNNTPEAHKKIEAAGQVDKQILHALLQKLGLEGAPEAAAAKSGGGYLGGLSDAAKNLMASGAQRIIVGVEAPKSVDINVNVTGTGIQSGRGSASLPISARGQHQSGITDTGVGAPAVAR
jgi:hypothetical protein